MKSQNLGTNSKKARLEHKRNQDWKFIEDYLHSLNYKLSPDTDLQNDKGNNIFQALLFLLNKIKLVSDLQLTQFDQEPEFDLLNSAPGKPNLQKKNKYQKIQQLKQKLQLVKDAMFKISTDRLNMDLIAFDPHDSFLINLFNDVINMVQRFEEIQMKGKSYTEELENAEEELVSITKKVNDLTTELQERKSLRNIKQSEMHLKEAEMIHNGDKVQEITEQIRLKIEENKDISNQIADQDKKLRTYELKKMTIHEKINDSKGRIYHEDSEALQ